MSIVHKQDQDNLLALADAIINPTVGQLVISDPIICKTCAYYVGYWCMEWMGSEWLAQPYDRESAYYNTIEEAESALKFILDEDENESDPAYWGIEI